MIIQNRIAMKNKTRLMIIGGFLGAGKTTLLYETTRTLMNEGKRVGLITNDQASELVDTAILLQTQAEVAEVSGSCFCCNFNGFINSIKQVGHESNADLIIAEPVGSCTDLSATIMQPLKEHYNNDAMVISPLTVLADPFRLAEILEGRTGGLHPSAAYIFQKQLEESDIILITKTDLLEKEQSESLKEKVKRQYPHSQVLTISSRTGEGIADWLALMEVNTKAGQRIVDVDYKTYAEGEAVLGWLNSFVSLQGKQINWDAVVTEFMEELSQKVDSNRIGVGHIKVILENGDNFIIGNITGTNETLSFRGTAGVSDEAKFFINARVETTPETLEKLVKEVLGNVTNDKVRVAINSWKCLSPGYPNPTFRYDKIVEIA